MRNCPNEIYQEIGSYLGELDKLSFALANPVIYRALGKDSWKSFRGRCFGYPDHTRYWQAPGQTREWARFLDMIKGTWPQFWYCSQCRIFHPHEKKRQTTNGDNARSVVNIGPVNSFQFCSVDLSSETVRSVFDGHHLGLKQGTCHEVFRLSKSNEHKWHRLTTEMNSFAEFRGCELTWQGTWDFSWYGTSLPRHYFQSIVQRTGFRFCHHLVWEKSSTSKLYPEMNEFIQRRLANETSTGNARKGTSSPSSAATHFSCTQCSTAFAVHVISRRGCTRVTFQVNKNFGSRSDRDHESNREAFNHFAASESGDGTGTKLSAFGTENQPLYFPCDSSCNCVIGCFVVKQCEHEATELLSQGRKPVHVDPAKTQKLNSRLSARALGYDDDFFAEDSDVSS